jgi:hypothetical protein
MKTLVLVADDYGLAPEIDRGILRLARRHRLGEVSCIVNAAGWRAAAPALSALPLRAGLHLNLTEGQPLSMALLRLWPTLPTLPRLIARAHARRLPVAALRDELRAQLDAFEEACGRTPAHLDGHQHVHHLPQLRELVLELLPTRPGMQARDTGHVIGPGFAVKRWLIAGTGGRALGRRLHALGRAQNRVLLGVYDFAEADYGCLFRAWLAAAPAGGGLVFCHPGEAAAGDPIATARVRELAYFDSDRFLRDLAEYGVTLAGEGPGPIDHERE